MVYTRILLYVMYLLISAQSTSTARVDPYFIFILLFIAESFHGLHSDPPLHHVPFLFLVSTWSSPSLIIITSNNNKKRTLLTLLFFF
ncbi:uncharacterized protein EV154DRAFT_504425, partial [Mucor mucedo]|uniref:uncharacterized protein n=1 Tax=Mucor mucedo TaxID=29922 RepID=UPI00221F1A5F